MKMLVNDEWLQKRIEADEDANEQFDIVSPEVIISGLGIFLHENILAKAQDVHEESQRYSNVIPINAHSLSFQKHFTFGRYINLKRRSAGMSITQLANKIEVDEDELRLIERDPHHQARPRTVSKLAEQFDDDQRQLMRLAGVEQSRDATIEKVALRFAAMSDDLAGLDRSERATLNELIKMLKEK